MHIRKIRSIRCYLNKQATKSLVNATVLSRLDYCNSLYIGLPLKSLYKLQLALNTAAQLISGTHRHSHITPVLQQLNWLPTTKRCHFKILIMTFKALHQLTARIYYVICFIGTLLPGHSHLHQVYPLSPVVAKQ